MKEDITNIYSWYEERCEVTKKFYEEKKYLTAIDKVVDEYIDIENQKWDSEIDELFNFLYKKAFELSLTLDDTEDIYIKHNDKYIRLFEMHGQGCYKSIGIVSDEPKTFVSYEDIINYHETGKKPYKVNVIAVINRGLDTLETALNSDKINIENETLSFFEIKKYLIENLK